MTGLSGKRMGSEFLRNEMTKKERWVWPSLKSNILLIQIPVKLLLLVSTRTNKNQGNLPWENIRNGHDNVSQHLLILILKNFTAF